MGEKVKILIGNSAKSVETIKPDQILLPEKNRIQTAVPIQSTHSNSVSIRKRQIANETLPK